MMNSPNSSQASWSGLPGQSRYQWRLDVLIIEDDPADAALISDVLTRHPDVTSVRTSDAPEQALARLRAGADAPDLILLDVHMPRMDGFEFIRRLRAIPAGLDVPTVFLTHSDLGQPAVDAGLSSALSYIIKPDSQRELSARLERVINRLITGEWPE